MSITFWEFFWGKTDQEYTHKETFQVYFPPPLMIFSNLESTPPTKSSLVFAHQGGQVKWDQVATP